MPTDPICGIDVDESTAHRVERDGQTDYFCSDKCRDECQLGIGRDQRLAVEKHQVVMIAA